MSDSKIAALNKRLQILEKRVNELEKTPVQCGCDELVESVIQTVIKFKQAKLKQG